MKVGNSMFYLLNGDSIFCNTENSIPGIFELAAYLKSRRGSRLRLFVRHGKGDRKPCSYEFAGVLGFKGYVARLWVTS